MRTTADRIRHAISFEVIALMLVTPLGWWLFDKPLEAIGVVTVVSATIATGWNYVFNIAFDRVMLRVKGHTRKTIPLRLLHTLLFEAGLLTVLAPFIAIYLGVSFGQAVVIDLSFSLFYLVYGFTFNWLYDVVFPIPDPV